MEKIADFFALTCLILAGPVTFYDVMLWFAIKKEAKFLFCVTIFDHNHILVTFGHITFLHQRCFCMLAYVHYIHMYVYILLVIKVFCAYVLYICMYVKLYVLLGCGGGCIAGIAVGFIIGTAIVIVLIIMMTKKKRNATVGKSTCITCIVTFIRSKYEKVIRGLGMYEYIMCVYMWCSSTASLI